MKNIPASLPFLGLSEPGVVDVLPTSTDLYVSSLSEKGAAVRVPVYPGMECADKITLTWARRDAQYTFSERCLYFRGTNACAECCLILLSA